MMNIAPQLIGFDIDCVVADTMEAFIRLADNDYGLTVVPEQITRFRVEKCLEIDPDIVEAIFTRLLEDPEKCGLKPMPHAVEVLSELAEGSRLNFVTARPDPEPIAAWLHGVLGSDIFQKVRLAASGEHDSKSQYINDMGLEYFVDDRARTCIQLSTEGINAIVFQQPWNRGRHNLPVVDSWLELRGMIQKPEARNQKPETRNQEPEPQNPEP